MNRFVLPSLGLMFTVLFNHAPARGAVAWRPVVGGAIENYGREEAKFYPDASARARPAVFGLNVGERVPTAGSAAAVARCIELREAVIGGQTWYRFRLDTAYARRQPEYDWCRQRKAVDACDSTVPLECDGRYYYLPKAPGGVGPTRTR